MTPDGKAFISVCARCDTPILNCYVEGRKLRLSTKSIPLADAVVLARYFEWIINVWSPVSVGVWPNTEANPIFFYSALWWRDAERPSRGTLHVKHLCRLRR